MHNLHKCNRFGLGGKSLACKLDWRCWISSGMISKGKSSIQHGARFVPVSAGGAGVEAAGE